MIKNGHEQDRELNRSTPNCILKWLSNSIILAGTIWVIIIFVNEIDVLRTGFEVKSVSWLIYTFIAGIIGLLLTVPVFRILLCFYSNLPISYLYAARLLFAAQILRHLPGRIWGMVYLVNETRITIPPVAMIRANIDFMLYSMVFCLLVSAFLIVGVAVDPAVATILVVFGISIVAAALRKDWMGKLILFVFKFAPARAAKYAEAVKPHEPLPWIKVGILMVLFVLVWCVYLSIWWALTKTFRALEDINIWLLCASYMIAWVGGYLAMITPGGLGVREASFIALASKITSLPNLTFLAVFIRLWQILIEFLLFLVFVFVKPNYQAVMTGNES